MHRTHGTVSKTHHHARLFGLRCGQMRPQEFAHNCGWYDGKGQKLGFGDLSLGDLQRIAEELPAGKMFLVLPESASFWDYFYGDMHDSPGADYVAGHAIYAIYDGRLYHVLDHEKKAPTHLHGTTLLPMTRETLWRKMVLKH